MAKIAGVGSKSCLWPFRYFGVETFFVPEDGDARQILQKIFEDRQVAVLLVTESVYRQASSLIDGRREAYLPAVTLIPDEAGNEGFALGRITGAIRKAVGMDVG